jgi:hypothetical protein
MLREVPCAHRRRCWSLLATINQEICYVFARESGVTSPAVSNRDLLAHSIGSFAREAKVIAHYRNTLLHCHIHMQNKLDN